MVDDNGKSINIYEQKDIGEFFLNLLDRLQDGLGENKNLIKKAFNIDFERQQSTEKIEDRDYKLDQLLKAQSEEAVSYTHLTLPTILRV